MPNEAPAEPNGPHAATALSQKGGRARAAGWIASRDGPALLSPPPLPAADHPAGDLALSTLHTGYRDVEELLAARGLDISYETVRRWVLKFGPLLACATPRFPASRRNLEAALRSRAAAQYVAFRGAPTSCG